MFIKGEKGISKIYGKIKYRKRGDKAIWYSREENTKILVANIKFIKQKREKSIDSIDFSRFLC